MSAQEVELGLEGRSPSIEVSALFKRVFRLPTEPG